MPAIRPTKLAIRCSEDLVPARRIARESLATLGFGLVDQTKVVTAVSELARNALEYGGGGEVTFEGVAQAGRVGLRISFEDHGPGIADIEEAMKDGFTTNGGLGLGLGGSRRLVNEFEIVSTPGNGTTVTIVKWR